jgi:hypothetical protein
MSLSSTTARRLAHALIFAAFAAVASLTARPATGASAAQAGPPAAQAR